MAEIVNCPQCARKLRVPEELLGQRVECPTCGDMFTAALGGSAPVPKEQPVRDERTPRPPAPDDDDDDEEDDDYYYERHSRSRIRRDARPDRGVIVLILGILSLVLLPSTLVGGLVLGPIAWVMGNNDLAAMRAGHMDRAGEGATNAGRICGMVATILSALAVFGCLFFILLGAYSEMADL